MSVTAPPHLLVVARLQHAYGSSRVLQDVDLIVRRGEIVGLLGRNGAGKTTTLSAIAGRLRPTSGNIQIDGRDIETMGVEARALVGFVPDEPSLIDFLTTDEHFELASRLVPERADLGVAHEVLRKLGLEAARPLRPDGLSRGMRQGVALALALMVQPALLVLDEPFTGLDPVAFDAAVALIRDHAAGGTGAVLLSSHLLTLVDRICHRVVVLADGRTSEDAAITALRESPLWRADRVDGN